MKSGQNAILALEDGTLFLGYSSSVEKTVCGEIVFNTSMTGYQEICTDPSYAHQIVLFTTPHIGNVGANREDNESERVWVKGIIVLEMSKTSSNWRSEESFISFLHKHNTPWIEGIDTRKLTRHLRENGAKKGCIMVGKPDTALALDLAKSHAQERELTLPPSSKNSEIFMAANTQKPKKIAVYDFGVKVNILNKLSRAGCLIKIIPGAHPIDEILSWQPDGVVISNGPGDPADLIHGIQETKKLISTGIPIFGICLGCQLIALAAGAKTKKMKYGHHGANHPVFDLARNKVFITSQNHHFTIDESSLPSHCSVTHHSLFDGTIQGIRLKDLPIFGFQGHPEGSPGPQDIDSLFEEFLHQAAY